MTISSTSNRKEYAGNGATTAFATSPVVFFDGTDLKVYKVVTSTGVATLQTLTTDYTVSGGSGSTGTVTAVVAPTSLETYVIVRTMPLTQAVDFVNNEATDAEVAEDALDKLTMLAQQLSAKIDRSFTLADSDVSGASTEIPTPAASKLIGWDSAGTGLANYASATILDTIIPTAFMETLLDDTTAAVARATLDAQEDVLTTIGDSVVATTAGAAARLAAAATVAAHATTMNPWVARNVTTSGSAVTFTDIADAPYVGASVLLTMNAAHIWTDGAVFDVQGGATYTTAAGDQVLLVATAVDAFDVTILPASGGLVGLAGRLPITLATAQASTSGTSIDFTGIPVGTKKITINFVGVSTNGTSPLQIQLGDAGGFESAGYSGGVTGLIAGGAISGTNMTAGFLVTNANLAASGYSGSVSLTLEKSSAFTWCETAIIADTVGTTTNVSGGSKSLSAELTQVRITTAGGADTFDAGEINITYE